jgi:hypothetical protein
VKSALAILLSVLSFLLADAADAQSTDFVGLVGHDARKLGDINTNSELWIVTLTRAPATRGTDLPAQVLFAYLSRKPNNPKTGQWPEGTEIKLTLTRRADGSYETVYFLDCRPKHVLNSY